MHYTSIINVFIIGTLINVITRSHYLINLTSSLPTRVTLYISFTTYSDLWTILFLGNTVSIILTIFALTLYAN